MLQYVLIGGGLGFAAGVQPGPLQAFLFSRVALHGWRRTLPASFAPLLSDGPIAVVALVVLGELSTPLQQILRAAGGLLLLYLGWSTLRQSMRDADERTVDPRSAPQTIFQAAAINLLNPNPYLGWALVLGPAAVHAWREAPSHGVALVGSFYVTMIATIAGTVVAFGTASFLSSRARRVLILLSGVILAALGVYQLIVSLS
jgi:threonine/homoserine/homoserine lactone efflux protein